MRSCSEKDRVSADAAAHASKNMKYGIITNYSVNCTPLVLVRASLSVFAIVAVVFSGKFPTLLQSIRSNLRSGHSRFHLTSKRFKEYNNA